jgi:hypothetical protein
MCEAPSFSPKDEKKCLQMLRDALRSLHQTGVKQMKFHPIDLKYSAALTALANEYFTTKMSKKENGRRIDKLEADCRAEFIAAGLDPKKSVYLCGHG